MPAVAASLHLCLIHTVNSGRFGQLQVAGNSVSIVVLSTNKYYKVCRKLVVAESFCQHQSYTKQCYYSSMA